MNFDATKIAIRERGFAEALDLALHVTRAHAGPLLLALAAGAAPWALLNWLLLGGLLSDSVWNEPSAYVFWMSILVGLETPLATAPITLYLGQVTFAEKIDVSQMVRGYFRSLAQMIWMQAIARILTFLLVITFIMPYVMWPYLSELILLERNPMFSGKGGRLTTRKRSKNLHRGAGGDLFTRWIVSIVSGLLLILALVGGIHVLAGQLLGVRVSTEVHMLFIAPLAAWLVVGFFAVVRFLAYLDLRIRREGWEVELTMRAEAERLARLA